MKELFDKRNKENILKMIKSTKTLADSLNETQSPISSILNSSNNNTNSHITTTNTITTNTNNSMMIKLKINKKPNDLFLQQQQQQTNQIKKRKHSLDSHNGNERTRSKSSRPYKTTSKQQQVVFTNTINNKTIKTKETVKSVWADESEICKWTVPVLVETTTTTTHLDFNPALITYNRPNLPIRQNRIIYKPDFTQTLRQRLNKNNIIIDTNDDFLILREKPPIPPVSTVHRNNNHTHNTNKIITLPRKINYESYFGHTNYFS